jgi:hypothetical protein
MNGLGVDLLLGSAHLLGQIANITVHSHSTAGSKNRVKHFFKRLIHGSSGKKSLDLCFII